MNKTSRVLLFIQKNHPFLEIGFPFKKLLNLGCPLNGVFFSVTNFGKLTNFDELAKVGKLTNFGELTNFGKSTNFCEFT